MYSFARFNNIRVWSQPQPHLLRQLELRPRAERLREASERPQTLLLAFLSSLARSDEACVGPSPSSVQLPSSRFLRLALLKTSSHQPPCAQRTPSRPWPRSVWPRPANKPDANRSRAGGRLDAGDAPFQAQHNNNTQPRGVYPSPVPYFNSFVVKKSHVTVSVGRFSGRRQSWMSKSRLMKGGSVRRSLRSRGPMLPVDEDPPKALRSGREECRLRTTLAML
ncbi:hypothetical protein CDD83_8889 [Cordyceps sp. RAO-2017]|nr:hypothetical protein CDD83_8889 [Cordyceps sp. RAO-2017]